MIGIRGQEGPFWTLGKSALLPLPSYWQSELAIKDRPPFNF